MKDLYKETCPDKFKMIWFRVDRDVVVKFTSLGSQLCCSSFSDAFIEIEMCAQLVHMYPLL